MHEENTITTPYKEIILHLITATDIAKLPRDGMSIDFFPARKTGDHSLLAIRLIINQIDRFVIKVPRHNDSAIAAESIINEYNNLQLLASIDQISTSIPWPAQLATINNIPVLITPLIESTEWAAKIETPGYSESFFSDFDKSLDVLIDLQYQTIQGSTVIDENFIDSYITIPFNSFAAALPEEAAGVASYIEQIKKNAQILTGQKIPLTWEHKDFNPYNIKIKPEGTIVILDMEDSKTQGLPLMDLFNHIIISSRLIRTGQNNGLTTQFIDNIPDYLKKYCTTLNINQNLIDLLFIVFILKITEFFLAEKRMEKEYSASWWYLLKLNYPKDILINCMKFESNT